MCKIKYLSMIAAAVMRTRPPVCRCPGVVMLSVTSDDKMWCVCDTTSHNITQHHTMSQVAQLAGGRSVSIHQSHTARVTTNTQTSRLRPPHHPPLGNGHCTMHTTPIICQEQKQRGGSDKVALQKFV